MLKQEHIHNGQALICTRSDADQPFTQGNVYYLNHVAKQWPYVDSFCYLVGENYQSELYETKHLLLDDKACEFKPFTPCPDTYQVHLDVLDWVMDNLPCYTKEGDAAAIIDINDLEELQIGELLNALNQPDWITLESLRRHRYVTLWS
ncbi:hypothetical protein [Endozoicomonas atrinae]|uniref:hypothetical protein n=1 Tax=Endozoicomonas atrinae TaxID=1333660 RepID=UPI000825CBF9|nr:hypothetical protein [Endozoicomonas atrinae]